MKATKKITRAGAVTIPKTVRSEVGMPLGAAVDIEAKRNCIVIRKHTPLCYFCGSPEKIISVMNVDICRNCAEKIGRKAGENNG